MAPLPGGGAGAAKGRGGRLRRPPSLRGTPQAMPSACLWVRRTGAGAGYGGKIPFGTGAQNLK